MLIEDTAVVQTTPEDITLENNVEPENPITNSEDTQDNDLDLIDFLLKEEIPEEEKPTEPIFFPNKEEQIEEEEQFIDEELLEDIEKWFTELEAELNTTKETLSLRDKDIEELNNTANAYSEALDKLGEHPILWPLNEKLLKWEKVDIPEYLSKSLQEDIDSLPNMENIASEPTWVQEVLSLQDKLARKAKQMY